LAYVISNFPPKKRGGAPASIAGIPQKKCDKIPGNNAEKTSEITGFADTD
jgi:hypothetical protein